MVEIAEWDGLVKLIHDKHPQLAYLRAVERQKGGDEKQEVAHLQCAGRSAIDLVDELDLAVQSYCDVDDPLVVRVRLYAAKGELLATKTLRSNPQAQGVLATAGKMPEVSDIGDLTTVQFTVMSRIQQAHVETMASNYQVLFKLVHEVLNKLQALLQERAVRAETHALALYDRQLEERKVTLASADEAAKKAADTRVQERAIETAGSVVERVLGGVLGAMGLDEEVVAGAKPLLGILKVDPDLKAALSDPEVAKGLEDPEVRAVLKDMFKGLKDAAQQKADAPATPQAEPKQ